MVDVFVLQHAYERRGCEEVKFIGVYSTRSRAEHAIQRMKELPGFASHLGGFHIDCYRVDEDHWASGFSTS